MSDLPKRQRGTSGRNETLGAAALRRTPDDVPDMEMAASKIPVQADRNPEELERMTYR